ncbi:MAG: hypothetical protein ACYC5O_23700 [Anaerolineae bacterium]
MTERELAAVLSELAAVSEAVAFVEAQTVRVAEPPVLSLRLHLCDGSFLEVYRNMATGKTCFALVVEGARIYGKDNDHQNWHVHPYGCPFPSKPCPPCSFADFLAAVEALRFAA